MRRFLVIILNPLVYFYVGRPIVGNICGESDDQVSIYRVAPSRLTHFKFEYCAGAKAYHGWREEER